MLNLCWTYQQNNTAILFANCSEEDKSDTIKAADEHLGIVQVERSFYKTTCDNCCKSVRTYFTKDGVLQLPPLSSNTAQWHQVRYSFDYAQQVHFPSNPLQPGPICFLTPGKCTVFGVNCEPLPRQVNFLTDEAGECGKGTNNIISCLHCFFETCCLAEKVVYLRADNYTGQNKSNAMIQYLAWRAATKQHTSLTLSFLGCRTYKFFTGLVLWLCSSILIEADRNFLNLCLRMMEAQSSQCTTGPHSLQQTWGRLPRDITPFSIFCYSFPL